LLLLLGSDPVLGFDQTLDFAAVEIELTGVDLFVCRPAALVIEID